MTMRMERIPDLFIERLACGDLDDEGRLLLEAEYGAEEVARRLSELRRSNSEILWRYPPEVMAERIRMRLAVTGSRSSLFATRASNGSPIIRKRSNLPRLALRLGAPLGAFIAVVIVGIVLFTNVLPTTGNGGPVRAKGVQSQLYVYKKIPGGAELLLNGDVVASGDRLQLAYVSTGNRYGVILSIDGRGAVTIQYPASSPVAARLKSGGEYALPYGYQLDNAPFFERFFLVVSDKPFRIASVEKAADKLAGSGSARTAPLRLPRGIAQHSFLLLKAGG